MKAKNYDGRTALHLAASEGHLPCVKFLVETCQLDPLEKDRLIKLSLLGFILLIEFHFVEIFVESDDKIVKIPMVGLLQGLWGDPELKEDERTN
jgi:hypothetical protein